MLFFFLNWTASWINIKTANIIITSWVIINNFNKNLEYKSTAL